MSEGNSISGAFKPMELPVALRRLKRGKSPGWILPSRSLYCTSGRPQILVLRFTHVLHAPTQNSKDLDNSTNSCDRKPESSLGHLKSYRLISLLCIPFKIFEGRISARVEPIIDSLHPKEQAGFRHARSTVDQVTMLTKDIEHIFSTKKKAGGVIVDLTAAYDTVWHRDLTSTLLQLIPDRHMVRMVMELIGDGSFTLTTGKRSRLRRLKNGVAQRSILAPFLFNNYISASTCMIGRSSAHAYFLETVLGRSGWQAVEGSLSKEMANLSEYHQTWKLMLSTTQTVSAVFHLNKRKLTVS